MKDFPEADLLRFRQMISEAQHIVICAHVGPDGDAIGSTLAMFHLLKRWEKDATVVVPNYFPDFLRWMPGAHAIRTYFRHEEAVAPILAKADLFLVCDLNTPSRLSDMMDAVMKNPAPKILIDHHLQPEPFCQLTFSRPEMCATCEVLCHMLVQMGEMENLSLQEATCLYCGMMCDTGAFTYGSTRPEVYECISRLLACGIDKDRIYRNVYWTFSPARMKLQGYMLYVKLQILADGHAALMTLTNEERRMFSIKNGDTEGIVNLPLQIQGMRLSIFLAEDTEHQGLVKVSLRSVDDFPCNRLAADFFNGGGHLNASGGRLQCTMAEAEERVHQALQAYAKLISGERG